VIKITKEETLQDTEEKLSIMAQNNGYENYEDFDILALEIMDGELLNQLLQTITEKAIDSKTAIQGLTLVNILMFINSLIAKVDILNNEFDHIEELLYPRMYNPILILKGIVRPKTLIAGYDNESLVNTINGINESLDEFKDVSDKLIKELEEKYQNEEMIEKTFLVDFGNFIDAVKNVAGRITDNIKVKLPISDSCSKNAKKLRKLLTDTQAVARETELLFVFFLKEVLKEHGQIRRDYGDIESQTNQIYSRLVVTDGEILLDGMNLAQSLKMIMKALKNIRGDLNALKIITIMLMRPVPDHPIQTRNILSKMLDKGGFNVNLKG